MVANGFWYCSWWLVDDDFFWQFFWMCCRPQNDASYSVGVALYDATGQRLCDGTTGQRAPQAETDWWLQVPLQGCPLLPLGWRITEDHNWWFQYVSMVFRCFNSERFKRLKHLPDDCADVYSFQGGLCLCVCVCGGLDWFVAVPVHTSQYWTILGKKWIGLYGSSGIWHIWHSQRKLKFPPARRIEKNSCGWRRSFGVNLAGSPYSIYPGCFQPYNISEEMECNKLLGYRLYI